MHRHVRGPGACFGSALLARSNTMTLRVLLAVVFALLGAVAAEAESSVNVHHRVRLPGDTSTPFTHKGTVLLTPTGLSYAPAAAFRSQLTAWSSNATTDARYEVALQTSPVEDGNPDDWPRASVKLCHVTGAQEEFLTMHKTLAGDIFALDYHLSSVPKDGNCPKPAPLYIASTDVQLKSPSPAFRPRLKTPTPMSADGQPVKAEPEKSFIQKYWMYIVPALIILLVLPAGPEEGGPQ